MELRTELTNYKTLHIGGRQDGRVRCQSRNLSDSAAGQSKILAKKKLLDADVGSCPQQVNSSVFVFF